MYNVKNFSQFINESIDEYYQVVYYETIGEHGSTGVNHPRFEPAFKEAIALKRRLENDKELGENKCQYIGVEGSGNEFAVVYITKNYLDNTDINYFKDEISYKNWYIVAKLCFESGIPQKGVYTDQGTLDL